MLNKRWRKYVSFLKLRVKELVCAKKEIFAETPNAVAIPKQENLFKFLLLSNLQYN